MVEVEVAKQRAQADHQQQRQRYNKTVAEQQVMEASAHAKDATTTDVRKNADMQRQMVSKLKVHVYRERLARNAKDDRQAALERSYVSKLQQQPKIIHNCMRVKFRDDLLCKKREDMHTQNQLKHTQDQAKEKRLQRIRGMVTYFSQCNMFIEAD